MAPLLFALALIASDPAAAGAEEAPWPTGAPETEYGLVAWCYGALTAHMKLHDQAMPEVERIERTWERTPGSADKAIAEYEEQRIEGVRAIAQFRRAMEAAEKASIKPIQEEGAAAIRQGASIWTGAAKADKRRLAQEWMSWGLPARCVPTAQALEKKSKLFGQAINYNVGDKPLAEEAAPPAEEAAAPAEEVSADDIGLRPAEPEAEAEPEPEAAVEETAPEAEPETAPEAAVEPEPSVEEAAPEAEPEVTEPEPEATVEEAEPEAAAEPEATVEEPAPAAEPEAAPAPAEDFVVDMDDPQPCPGRLEPQTRDGQDVLVCKVNP